MIHLPDLSDYLYNTDYHSIYNILGNKALPKKNCDVLKGMLFQEVMTMQDHKKSNKHCKKLR